MSHPSWNILTGFLYASWSSTTSLSSQSKSSISLSLLTSQLSYRSTCLSVTFALPFFTLDNHMAIKSWVVPWVCPEGTQWVLLSGTILNTIPKTMSISFGRKTIGLQGIQDNKRIPNTDGYTEMDALLGRKLGKVEMKAMMFNYMPNVHRFLQSLLFNSLPLPILSLGQNPCLDNTASHILPFIKQALLEPNENWSLKMFLQPCISRNFLIARVECKYIAIRNT